MNYVYHVFIRLCSYFSQFAAFIIGDKCDGINAILVRIDDKLNGDDKCIDVIASLTAVCNPFLFSFHVHPA